MTTRLYDPLTYENLMLKKRREAEEKVKEFFARKAA